MNFTDTALVCALLINNRKKERSKVYRLHKAQIEYPMKAEFDIMFEDLQSKPNKFFKYFQMSSNAFNELLEILKPAITYQDTNFRLAIPAKERLAVTLRYFTTGSSFAILSSEFSIGISTVRKIVDGTSDGICNILKSIYMPTKREEDWIKIADQFYVRTKFPNIIGVLIGKHIQIIKPQNSYKHKKFFSVVLVGWVDANYQFVYIGINTNESTCEISEYPNLNLGTLLDNNLLNIPNDRTLPNDKNGREIPFCLVADEAFCLSRRILRQYFQRKDDQTSSKTIFNHRHASARRIAESTFSMLYDRWGIIRRPLDVGPILLHKIIMACCLLHNFMRSKESIKFHNIAFECPLNNVTIRPEKSIMSTITRNYFTSYFASSQETVR